MVQLAWLQDGEGRLMFCNRLFDFVTQTEVVLAGPPCRNAEMVEREKSVLDIIRPNRTAADLIRRHEKALLDLERDRAA